MYKHLSGSEDLSRKTSNLIAEISTALHTAARTEKRLTMTHLMDLPGFFIPCRGDYRFTFSTSDTLRVYVYNGQKSAVDWLKTIATQAVCIQNAEVYPDHKSAELQPKL